MGLKEDIEILLQEENPDRGQMCNLCGHRDGHHLQYCYKCSGIYVPYKETWEQSLRRFATNKNHFNNRVESFVWAYKKFFIWDKYGRKVSRELEDKLDSQLEEFKEILYTIFNVN